ncbi:nicotinate-nucleotide adenylyltransferase [Atopococcus tabaci]|uniref:nicotinate-nucleotide adenylyltransferase n=1 Tax=Atopococcus tabaci TaxID=269774 RepID=UPI0003FA7DD5|nr:nicotinate-nucleotide adenylyltransferase [Atopococcus tabaci]
MQQKPSTIIHEEVEVAPLYTESKRKVGILGGTFNPPHIGHLIIAEQVRDQLGLEEILFIPDAKPPHASGKRAIEAEHRVEMVARAIEDWPAFKLDTIEIIRGGKSYTYDTMVELRENRPDTEFYFIIGADMVMDLPNWYKIDELVNLVSFVGVNRPGYVRDSTYPIIWVDVPDIQVSSTDLRKKIFADCSVKFLVPDQVIAYIKEENLYQDE